MRDRISTKILGNGATRYGVYDETGKLLRYEYIKLEDEPTVEGDLFSKANMLPDSIPAALGLKMGNPQVKDALNVLANIGNLHVWQRVRKHSEAGYTLGSVVTDGLNIVDAPSNTAGGSFSYSDSVSVSDDGVLSLVSPATTSVNYNSSGLQKLIGKFVTYNSGSYLNIDGIIFIPIDATITSGTGGKNGYVATVNKYQTVTGYASVTTTDYLTSTDRNAYPDQSAEGGQDAYYTLGDVVTSEVYLGYGGASNVSIINVSDSISVSDDGTITQTNPQKVTIGYGGTINYETDELTTLIARKFLTFVNKGNIPEDMPMLDIGNLYYIPSSVTVTFKDPTNEGMEYHSIDKYQPVTGHAAIPANTTITYLGQLGGGARIEVGSYVGTGTEGSANPNRLTFGFVPKMVIVVKQGQYGFALDGTFSSYSLFWIPGITYFNPGGGSSSSYADAQKNKITLSGKTLSWYRDSTSSNGCSAHQLNESGKTYYYVAIS